MNKYVLKQNVLNQDELFKAIDILKHITHVALQKHRLVVAKPLARMLDYDLNGIIAKISNIDAYFKQRIDVTFLNKPYSVEFENLDDTKKQIYRELRRSKTINDKLDKYVMAAKKQTHYRRLDPVTDFMLGRGTFIFPKQNRAYIAGFSIKEKNGVFISYLDNDIQTRYAKNLDEVLDEFSCEINQVLVKSLLHDPRTAFTFAAQNYLLDYVKNMF